MRITRTCPALALIAVAAQIAAAAPARAERPSLIVWPGPEVIAGEVVDLEWEGPPAGVEEVEILLSVDDGRSFPLRVTPELDARERHYRWRVPDLSTARARLRIRIGGEGGEVETGATAPFRIAGARGGAPREPLVHEGTFWNGLTPAGGMPAAGISPLCHLDTRMGGSAAAESPPRDPLAHAAGAAVAPVAGAARATSTPPAAAVPHRPRFTPLRI